MTHDDADFSQFKITTKEVWRDLQQFRMETREENSEIRQLLANIDNKLDVVTVTMTHATKSVDDHENRIRSIEKHIWKAAGAAGFVGASAGIVVSLFLQ